MINILGMFLADCSLMVASACSWSNKNLQRIASKVKSPLVFAHVRASTTGALSEENCHPWVRLFPSLMSSVRLN